MLTASVFFYALCLTSRAFAFGSVELRLQPWTTSCQAVATGQPQLCGLPAALAPEIAITLTPPAGPPVAMTSQALNLEPQMTGTATLFAVTATAAQAAYVQLRIELTTPARALCMISQQWVQQAPLVPLICVGYDAPTLTQTGLTVTGTILN